VADTEHPSVLEMERFEIKRHLGSGGMGDVYEAYDHQRRSVVALKQLQKVNATSLYRFKKEFRELTDISHPNRVSLYELISADDCWYISMEMVHGRSGIGKSMLLRRFIKELSEKESPPLVLEGRCYERESVPYKAFDGIVDAISQHMSKLDKIEAAAMLPADIESLVRLFPTLRIIPVMARRVECVGGLGPRLR
jgi:hypothetical protein